MVYLHCDADGALSFYVQGGEISASALVPNFPRTIQK